MPKVAKYICRPGRVPNKPGRSVLTSFIWDTRTDRVLSYTGVFVGCFETDRVSSQTGRVLFMTDRVIQNTGRYYNIHYCLLENRPGLMTNWPVFIGTWFPRGVGFATMLHVMCIFFLYVIVPSVHVLCSFFLHTPTGMFKDPPPCVSNPVEFICCLVGYKNQKNEHMLTIVNNNATSPHTTLFSKGVPRSVRNTCIMITQLMQISNTHTHSFCLSSLQTNTTVCKLHHK